MAAEDSFKILRLRLLRPPPAFVTLPSDSTSRRPLTVPITLAVGVTDDYGVHIDTFDSLDLQLQVVDPSTSLPIPSISLAIDGSSPVSSRFTISGPAGPFHTLRTTLTFLKPLPSTFKAFRILLAVRPKLGDDSKALSTVSERMRSMVGEEQQAPVESWEEQRFIFMRALSGEVELRSGKKGQAEASSDKVQTIYRHIHLPPFASSTGDNLPPQPLAVVERPGLNNSTGQRLWDCAIGITCWLSLHPELLCHSLPSSSPPSETPEPPLKRPRPAPPRPHTILELGAGSALASLVTSRMLYRPPSSTSTRLLATDVEATVSTTLAENLRFNPTTSRLDIKTQVLNWGPVTPARRKKLLPELEGEGRLTILGADILYNPESHEVLLESLLGLLRAGEEGEEGDRAFIAYKARTEGDDGFFDLARGRGLEVVKVWEWGDVSVWKFAR